MRTNKLAAWAGAAAFALLTPLAHANFVTNGGFETGDFSGWTQFGDTSFTAVSGGPAVHSGSFGAAFGPAAPGGISQLIATTAGVDYVVDFWLQLDDSATPNSFSWSWNGVTQAPVFVDAGAFGYTEFSAVVTGAAGSSTLEFTFLNENSFFDLDDVSVVPEPGTLALMGVAMLAGGVARRRKKLN
jgi:hypothetical protein